MMKMTMRGLTLCGLVALLMGSVGCLAASDGDGGGRGKDGYCSISSEQEGAGTPCDSTVDCNDGLRCERLNGERVCLQLCDDNGDCDFSVCNLPDSDRNNDRNNGDNNVTVGGDNNSQPPNNNDNNTDPPNNNDNNGDPPPNNNDNNSQPLNNNDNNDNNGDPPPNNNDNNSQPLDLCEEACTKLIQCTEQSCPGELDLTAQECFSQCEPDPETFQAELILELSCTDIATQVCPPEGQETDAGQSCTDDSQCDAGTLQPFCFPETDPETGDPTGWDGGYCTAVGCQSNEQCGTGKVCLQIDEEGTTACFLGCDPNGSGSECRDNYDCPDISGNGLGACVPPQPE